MAEKELARTRRSFVERVSDELIKQLLDDLLDDGVINDGEMNSILKTNSTTADRARSLIDTVKKKGDSASRYLISYIKNRDTFLYSQLGLSSGQPAQAESKPQQEQQKQQQKQQEQQWSTKMVPSTDSFWKEKQDDPSIYPVTKETIRGRVALLITNIKFTNHSLDRNGAEKDEENMEKLLESLGYEVVKHTNLTGEAINAAVIEFSKHPKLKRTDSIVVVIMSHGKLGAILGVEWTEEKPDEFSIDKIYTHLGPVNCPALLNKPKIIIIQACRGVEKGSVLVSDDESLVCDDISGPSASVSNIADDALRYVHKEKDFIALLSSTPDTVSYRHSYQGSFLIQYLVEVFNTFAHKDDVEELFRKVMRRFEEFVSGPRRQMPTKDRCTLIKHFFFFPGL